MDQIAVYYIYIYIYSVVCVMCPNSLESTAKKRKKL